MSWLFWLLVVGALGMNSEHPYKIEKIPKADRKVTPNLQKWPRGPPTPPSPPSDPPKTPKSADGADHKSDPKARKTHTNPFYGSGTMQKGLLRVLAKWVFWVLWGGPRASRSQILGFSSFFPLFFYSFVSKFLVRILGIHPQNNQNTSLTLFARPYNLLGSSIP